MTISEIKKEIINVMKESTETEVEITEQTHIINDMSLSSVETMMMISDLEDRFGITIPSSALRNIRTVEDLCDVIIHVLLAQ